MQSSRYRVTCLLCLAWLGWADPAFSQVFDHPDPAFRWVLGPVLRGPSPWPWLDATEPAVADVLFGPMTTPPTVVPGPGTLVATAPPNQIVNGQLTAAGANSAVVWTGTGTNFTQADVGQRIVVNWDADGNGSNQGRRVIYINAVRSPTEIVSANYYMTEPPEAFATGRTWGRLGVSFYPWDANHAASQNVMFYEAGLAAARLFARTQLPKHQQQFHALCTNWWRWGLGSGYGPTIPRNAGLHAMLACATDPSYVEPAGFWTGIARLTQTIAQQVTTTTGGQVGYNPTSPVLRGTFDVREASYVLRYTAVLARTYAGHSAEWCGYLANQVTHLWLATAVVPVNATSPEYAYWEEDLFAMNPSYIAASSPAGDLNGRFGTSPWRATGLPINALIYAYEALSDPATCNNPTLAAQLFTPTSGLMTKAAHFLYDYGRSPDGGVFYNVGYESDTGNIDGGTVISNTPGVTVTVTNGSAQVVGTGTNFLTLFASSLGPTYIGLLGTPESNRRVYRVQSVTDDTHLTLNLPYAGPSATIGYFGRGVQASTTCGPLSKASYCELDRWSGRNLAADTSYGFAWLFAKTGAPLWRQRAEYFLNKTFGGAAGGSGSIGPPTGTCVGDVLSNCADGGTGNLGEILPGCSGVVPAPCGEGYLNPKYGKPWGMANGAGNTTTGIALLATTVTPPPPPPPSNPCVTSPLSFRVNRWPAQATGSRRFDYASSVPATIVLNLRVSPWTATATNAGGCVVTVTR